MADLRCAFAVLPAEGGDADRALASLTLALANGSGDFAVVQPIQPVGRTAREVLESAVSEAIEGKFDWLLAVSAAETLAPDIFVKMQPALRVHDCRLGRRCACDRSTATPPKLERITRLAAQDFPTFFHAALRWWIGPAHFVRPALARDALRAADTSAWYANYMLNLWKRGSAYKTAQCLTHFHAPLPQLC